MSDCSTNAFARRKPQRSYDDLERRCQQLERVAREMLDLLEATIDPSCEESCPVYDLRPDQVNCIEGFRNRLEALGVSVDEA